MSTYKQGENMTQTNEWTEQTDIGFVDTDFMHDLVIVRQILKNQHYNIVVYKKTKADEKSVAKTAKTVSDIANRLKEILSKLPITSHKLSITLNLNGDIYSLTVDNLSYATTTAISQQFLEDEVAIADSAIATLIQENIKQISINSKNI